MRVLLCPLSDRGYLYPALAVGRELSRRRHTVHVLARATAAPALVAAELPLLPAEHYGGQGMFSVSHWADDVPGQYTAVLRAARQLRPDVLVTSVLCLGSLLAAEVLDVPVVVLGFAAHIWNYRGGAGGEPASPLGLPVGRAWITREMLRLYGAARQRTGLAPRPTPFGDEPYLGDLTLLRGHPKLEYPGAVLPDRVHNVGPCAWEPPADPGWLAELDQHLDRVGKPVTYVHLGRVFGGVDPWPRLNAMFTGGAFQAVVERGRSTAPAPDPSADILLVRLPWMGPLIERSELVLSSGTSAPVLNALLRGRPLGVSPQGSEQPLLAQACVRAGVAVHIPPAIPRNPAAVLHTLRDDAVLHRRVARLGRELAAAGGSARAADLVEQVSCVSPAPASVGQAPRAS
jgi:UDP:flavonoid glycosyltransferase YjiC (YdhE family)